MDKIPSNRYKLISPGNDPPRGVIVLYKNPKLNICTISIILTYLPYNLEDTLISPPSPFESQIAAKDAPSLLDLVKLNCFASLEVFDCSSLDVPRGDPLGVPPSPLPAICNIVSIGGRDRRFR